MSSLDRWFDTLQSYRAFETYTFERTVLLEYTLLRLCARGAPTTLLVYYWRFYQCKLQQIQNPDDDELSCRFDACYVSIREALWNEQHNDTTKKKRKAQAQPDTSSVENSLCRFHQRYINEYPKLRDLLEKNVCLVGPDQPDPSMQTPARLDDVDEALHFWNGLRKSRESRTSLLPLWTWLKTHALPFLCRSPLLTYVYLFVLAHVRPFSVSLPSYEWRPQELANDDVLQRLSANPVVNNFAVDAGELKQWEWLMWAPFCVKPEDVGVLSLSETHWMLMLVGEFFPISRNMPSRTHVRWKLSRSLAFDLESLPLMSDWYQLACSWPDKFMSDRITIEHCRYCVNESDDERNREYKLLQLFHLRCWLPAIRQMMPAMSLMLCQELFTPLRIKRLFYDNLVVYQKDVRCRLTNQPLSTWPTFWKGEYERQGWNDEANSANARLETWCLQAWKEEFLTQWEDKKETEQRERLVGAVVSFLSRRWQDRYPELRKPDAPYWFHRWTINHWMWLLFCHEGRPSSCRSTEVTSVPCLQSALDQIRHTLRKCGVDWFVHWRPACIQLQLDQAAQALLPLDAASWLFGLTNEEWQAYVPQYLAHHQELQDHRVMFETGLYRNQSLFCVAESGSSLSPNEKWRSWLPQGSVDTIFEQTLAQL